MATVPLTNRFHTTTAQVPTVNLGSALANSDRETYSMQDIVDTVTLTGGVDGSGTAGRLTKWSDANTVTDSIISESGSALTATATFFEVTGTVKGTDFSVAALNTAPALATSTGTTGEIRWVADAVYLCIATDTWVKADLATF